MMKVLRLITLFSIVLIALACNKPTPVVERISDDMVFARIDSVMQDQESRWNEGDVRGFMQGYWNSDSLSFIGKSGLNKGWSKTLTNYLLSYPDPEAMGRLVFENLEQQRLGDDVAFVIGKWTLYRTADTLSGHYSLIWKQIDGKWLVTSDHSS